MTRRVFHCISWVSVALFVVTVVMWCGASSSATGSRWSARDDIRWILSGGDRGGEHRCSARPRRDGSAPKDVAIWGLLRSEGIALVPPSHLGFGISNMRQTGATTARSPISLHFIGW